MTSFTIRYSAADLPLGPFDHDRDQANEWLLKAAPHLRDIMTARCNEILQEFIHTEITNGNLPDEPDKGDSEFWEYFE